MSSLLVYGVVLALAAGQVAATESEEEGLLDHDPSPAEVVQGRDLKTYEDGGYHLDARMDADEFMAMRRFIWDHWRLKKRGYVRFRSIDMDTSTEEHIFIEPAANGKWHIQFRTILRWSGGDVVRRYLHEHEMVSLEREPSPAGEYQGKETLVFRARDGQTRRI
jgi:hypothetical protein